MLVVRDRAGKEEIRVSHHLNCPGACSALLPGLVPSSPDSGAFFAHHWRFLFDAYVQPVDPRRSAETQASVHTPVLLTGNRRLCWLASPRLRARPCWSTMVDGVPPPAGLSATRLLPRGPASAHRRRRQILIHCYCRAALSASSPRSPSGRWLSHPAGIEITEAIHSRVLESLPSTSTCSHRWAQEDAFFVMPGARRVPAQHRLDRRARTRHPHPSVRPPTFFRWRPRSSARQLRARPLHPPGCPQGTPPWAR